MISKIKYIFIILCFLLVGCKEKTDIDFAKDFFEKLVDGKTSVIDDIDWDSFSGTGFDLGGKLNSISDIKEKENIKRNFLDTLTNSLKRNGLEYEKFINWKIEDENGSRTIISAEYKFINYLYIVVLNKYDGKKISSIILTNPDLQLPVTFTSTKEPEIKYNEMSTIYFPQSLIDKNTENKNKKDEEIIRKSGYMKRVGVSFKRDLPPEYFMLKVVKGKEYKSSEKFFDSNGICIKSISYDFAGKKMSEWKIDSIPKSSKDYKVNLVNDKSGLYEESGYYYTLIDSLHYRIHKIVKTNTALFKYNDKGNLVNLVNISNSGFYAGSMTLNYDSSENIVNKIIYLQNGGKADSIYKTKYDSNGKIIEDVRYYSPGTFDILYLMIIRCQYKYDSNGNLSEKNYSNPDEDFQGIIYTYDFKNKVNTIDYKGLDPFFEFSLSSGVIFKYNDSGLLLEITRFGEWRNFSTVTRYNYFK